MRAREARLAVLGAALLLGFACVATESPAEPSQRRGRVRSAPKPKASPPRERAVFSHRVEAHGRSCDTCHTFPSTNWKTVRTGDAAFPDVTEFPTHGSCLGCHRQQFFARERPAPKMCSVCHEAVTPRSTGRLPFPNPSGAFRASARGREFVSEFAVSFPHETHLAVMGDASTDDGSSIVRVASRAQAAKGAGVCATCHQTYLPQGDGSEYAVAPPASLGDRFWLKRGTFQTSPEGHESCFTCHSTDGGLEPRPSDCAACHKPAPALPAADFDPAAASAMGVTDATALEAWRRRVSSATFRHEGGFHTEVACATCHDVAAMNTARTTKVRVLSCAGDMGCHVTATVADGGALNFEVERRKADPGFRCAKCHLAYGTAPVPASHVDAIAALGAK
jgi:hypothetical protein